MTPSPPDSPLADPPDDYDAAERAAWRAGARTALQLVASQASVLGGHLEQRDAADDETCPACGEALVEGFGGTICMECQS